MCSRNFELKLNWKAVRKLSNCKTNCRKTGHNTRPCNSWPKPTYLRSHIAFMYVFLLLFYFSWSLSSHARCPSVCSGIAPVILAFDALLFPKLPLSQALMSLNWIHLNPTLIIHLNSCKYNQLCTLSCSIETHKI